MGAGGEKEAGVDNSGTESRVAMIHEISLLRIISKIFDSKTIASQQQLDSKLCMQDGYSLRILKVSVCYPKVVDWREA